MMSTHANRRDTDMARITLDRVTPHFGAVTAVDDLSFTLEPGSITGIRRGQRRRQVDRPAGCCSA